MPAANFGDKKFLVVTVKAGGEDSYGTLLSRLPEHLAVTQTIRPGLAFSQTELEGAYTGSKLEGSHFSLHPALLALRPLWDAGDMAITHRVGPMFTNIADTPIAEIRQAAMAFNSVGIQFPLGIGAHDKQAFGTCSMIAREFQDDSGVRYFFPGQGFLGRLAKRFDGFIGNSPLPMSIVCGDVLAAAFLATDGLSLPLALPLAGERFRRDPGGGTTQASALRRLDAIMAQACPEPRTEAFRQANLLVNLSVDFLQPVVEAPYGSYAVDQDFPVNSGGEWQGIMRTFARTVETDMRNAALPARVAFVGEVSGYDTHFQQGKQTGPLASLHADWAASVAGFRSAMIRLGQWNNTLVLDHSEFSRSLIENGSSGTDHAYARDAFAFGGAVRGRGKLGSSGLFGTYPSVLSASGTGSFDLTGGEAAGGSLAPGISLEQYWEEPLRWFGADAADIAVALPRRSAFGPSVTLVG
jgi:uncharacterized protein (DUF1501 family)